MRTFLLQTLTAVSLLFAASDSRAQYYVVPDNPNATYLLGGIGFEEFVTDGFTYDSDFNLIPFAQSRYSDTTTKGDPSFLYPAAYVSRVDLYFNGTNLSSAWDGEGGLANPGDVGAYGVFSTSTVGSDVQTTRRLTVSDPLYNKGMRTEVYKQLIAGETRDLVDYTALGLELGSGRKFSLRVDSSGYRITSVRFAAAKVGAPVTVTWFYSLDGAALIATGVTNTVSSDGMLAQIANLSGITALDGATNVWLVGQIAGSANTILVLDNIQVIGMKAGGTTPTSPATLSGTPTPTATVGTAYTHTFTVGGSPAPVLSVTAGTLPPGISLSGNNLSGTPTTAGNFPGITVTASNSAGPAQLTFAIAVNGLATVSGSPASGVVNTAFTHTFTVGGYPAPTSVTLQSGALPPGLALSGLILSGTPTTSGTYTYTVRATNSFGSADLVVTQAINAPPTIAPPASLTAIRGTAYSGTFTLGGFPIPSAITLQSGALPAGLLLSSAGISGTPTLAGTYSFTVAATNAAGTTTRAVTFDVQSVPTVTLPSGGTLTFSTLSPATADIVADGLPAPVVTVGGLPAWLTVTSSSNSTTGRTTATLSGTPPIGAAPSYSLTVHATNAAGSPTDQTLTLNIVATTSAPTISTQPVGGNVALNGSYTFTVVAAGVPTPTFQWRRNTAAITGATASSYSVTGAQAGDAADYSVVVTNNTGTVTSASATLVVLVPVTITAQPASIAVGVGDPVNLSVAATGLAPLTYQWRKDGAPISGATGNSYSIASATLTSAGNFDVIVTNPAGSVTSATATVAVAAPPTIATHPVGGTFAAGRNVALSVVAQSVTPLTYQWRKNGAAIPGATDATLEITSGTVDDSGSYDVVATNNRGSVTSTPAVVVFIAAPQIVSGPVSSLVVSGNSVGFSVTATPAGVEYQWFRDGAVIPGATESQLTVYSVGATEAHGAYTCRVSNFAGSVTSAPGYVVAYAPVSRVVPLTGGSFDFEVLNPAPYGSWTVSSDASWLTAARAGDTVKYTVTAVTDGQPRLAHITVDVPGLGAAVHEVSQREFVVFSGDFSRGFGQPGSPWSPLGAAPPAVVPGFAGRTDVLGLGALGTPNAGPSSTSFAAVRSRSALSGNTDRRLQTEVFLAIDSPGSGLAESFMALVEPTASASSQTEISPAATEPASSLRVGLWHGGPESDARLRGHTWLAVRFKAADGKFRSLNLATAVPADELANRWVRLATDIGRDGKLSVWIDPEPFGDPVRVWTSATAVHPTVLGEQAFLLGLRGDNSANRPYQSSPLVSGGFAPRSGAGRIVGLSTRTFVGTGERVAIAGVAYSTRNPARMLVRGVGPALAGFGVAHPLATPRLVAYDDSDPAYIVRVQDAWEKQRSADTVDQIRQTETDVGLFPLAAGAADSAMLYYGGTPSLRTVHLKSADGAGEGEALLEFYALDQNVGSEMIAISTRAYVPAGGHMIPGFVVSGNSARLFAVRGVGPALARQGVAGPLARTALTLYRGNSALLQNAGWSMAPSAALLPSAAIATGAFALDAASGDSAILVRLVPGIYTVPITAATSGEAGVALAEIYALPLDAELDTVTE